MLADDEDLRDVISTLISPVADIIGHRSRMTNLSVDDGELLVSRFSGIYPIAGLINRSDVLLSRVRE